VVFYDPFLPNGIDRALGVTRVRHIDDVFRAADTISLHCQYSSSTHHIVNDHTLGLLKPGAIIVNTARGELVDIDALERVLRSGQLAAAGLDPLEVEPIPEPAPALIQAYRARENWLMGRLVITSHTGYYSPQATTDLQALAAETMRDVLLDGLDTNVVDPQAW
jgi:C-terminal binding protein